MKAHIKVEKLFQTNLNQTEGQKYYNEQIRILFKSVFSFYLAPVTHMSRKAYLFVSGSYQSMDSDVQHLNLHTTLLQ